MKKLIQLLTMLLMVTTFTFSSSLKFSQQPNGDSANVLLSKQPIVAIHKWHSGDSEALVTLSLTHGEGTLSGTLSKTTVSGVAKFTDIKVNASTVYHNGFRITAKAIGYSSEQSHYFLFDALPVELTSFTAQAKGTVVTLNWNTATETNNFGFDIERRDGVWTKVGFVTGAGTSSSPKDYSFTDKTANGTVQYRLKQIDRDGAFTYSDEIEVNILAPSVFLLNQNYPNPFNPSTTISFTLPISGFARLTVFDITGREVKTLVAETLTAGNYSRVLLASDLTSGMYVYRLTVDKFSETKKLTVIK